MYFRQMAAVYLQDIIESDPLSQPSEESEISDDSSKVRHRHKRHKISRIRRTTKIDYDQIYTRIWCTIATGHKMPFFVHFRQLNVGHE